MQCYAASRTFRRAYILVYRQLSVTLTASERRYHHLCYCFFFFFFSSRRRHTRFDCDWSSDVCSSDLGGGRNRLAKSLHRHARRRRDVIVAMRRWGVQLFFVILVGAAHHLPVSLSFRSEERRVGKECRSRWAPYH